MSDISNFSIAGASELEKVLTELPKNIAANAVFTALTSGAKIIAEEAKSRVPIRSGALRDSITVKRANSRERARGNADVVIGFKSPASRRAHLVEYGTRKMAAHPFMRPAIDAKAAESIDKIGKTLGEQIEKRAIKLAGSFAKSGLKKR